MPKADRKSEIRAADCPRGHPKFPGIRSSGHSGPNDGAGGQRDGGANDCG